MKVWKLVSGILSIIFFMLVVFQSCAVGISNTLSENGESSGTGGIFLALFMIAAGIVSIASHKSNAISGNIAIIILYCTAAFIGLALSGGGYGDLPFWAIWCLICATVVEVSSMIKVVKSSGDMSSMN